MSKKSADYWAGYEEASTVGNLTIAQLMQDNADLVAGHNRLIDMLSRIQAADDFLPRLPKRLSAELAAVLDGVTAIEDNGVIITIRRPPPTQKPEEPGPFDS